MCLCMDLNHSQRRLKELCTIKGPQSKQSVTVIGKNSPVGRNLEQILTRESSHLINKLPWAHNNLCLSCIEHQEIFVSFRF